MRALRLARLGRAVATEALPKKPRARRAIPAALTVTAGAAARIAELVAGAAPPRPIGVLLGVRARGCNGMSYTLNYAREGDAGALDEVVTQHGATVVVGSSALFHVVGTEMDWAETALSAEFVFTNPNAKGECGCGESFNVE